MIPLMWPSRKQQWPSQGDATAVRQMTTAQWRGISRRTRTYLDAYRDNPGSQDRAQRRAEWLAALPIWEAGGSILEVGCGAGRNLAALGRHWPGKRLLGADLNHEAIVAAREAVPAGLFEELDLYDVPHWPHAFVADTVLTCGVLCHLGPSTLPGVIRALVVRARHRLVLVEHFADGKGSVCLKGPKAWHPALRATSEGYCLWSLTPGRVFGVLSQTFERRGWAHMWIEVPPNLQAPGATRLLVMGETIS